MSSPASDLSEIATGAFTLFLCSASVDSLWCRPANDLELAVITGGYASAGSDEQQHRTLAPFRHISLTYSYFIISAILALEGDHEEARGEAEIAAALRGIHQYVAKDGRPAYGTSLRTPGGGRPLQRVISPRHTASALMIFHICKAHPESWTDSIEWLLDSQNGNDDCNDGWADEEGRSESDCDSTAAAIAALDVHLDRYPNLETPARTRIVKSIVRGLNWLQQQYARSGVRQWQYIQPHLDLTDTCYVLFNILPIVNRSWLPVGNREFIEAAVGDLCRRFNANGSLGPDPELSLLNTAYDIWALVKATEAGVVFDRQCISRAFHFLMRKVDKGEHVRHLGVVGWALFIHALAKTGAVHARRAQLARCRSLVARYKPNLDSDEYPFELISALPKEVCAIFKYNYVFPITHGRAKEIKVFISYRRSDTREIVSELTEALREHFSVFLDTSSIPGGKQFQYYLANELATSDVLLAVIGPNWFKGRVGWLRELWRRHWGIPDYVQMELELAWSRNICVLPLLVEATPMPGPKQLPPSIQQIALLNALSLNRGSTGRLDVSKIVPAIHTLSSRHRG